MKNIPLPYSKKLVNPIFFIIFCLLSSFSFWNCNGKYSGKTSPVSVQGVLNIDGNKKWDVLKDGPISLNGEWEFYWKKLLKPGECKNNISACSGIYIFVPKHWLGWKLKNHSLEYNGYATYRIVVKLSEIKNLSLKLNRIGTAYKLFINGSLLSEIGKVSKDPNLAQAYFYPQIIDIPDSDENELEILLQVSNYHHRRGGIIEKIVLGNKKQINSMRESNLTLDLFLVGSLIIMGFYHFGLFLLRRNNLLALYFAVLCSSLALNSLMFGERYFYRLFDDFPYNWGVTLEFLTFNSAVPAFLLFISRLFPEEVNQKALKVIISSCLIVIAFILIFPPNILTFIINISYILIITVVIYAFFIMIIAITRKREGAKIFLSGFIIFALFIINDILYVTNIIKTAQVVPLGFFWFIFSQAFFLSMRFSNAFSTVEILSSNLEKQNKKLQQLDKLKDEFLSNTSHELRTPLNGIIGITESLVDGIAGKVNHVMQKNLLTIISSGKRLSSLINDILDFSKLKNRQLQLKQKPIELRAIVELVMVLSEPLLNRKPVELKNKIPENLFVFADENRLQQIFFNLIGNSIKFTDKGEIIVSLDESSENSDFITIEISDTGIGISTDKLEMIFQAFEQEDASTERRYGGTGIGLSITKQLVELHKGKIWVQSTPKKGSKFFFNLPRASTSESLSEKNIDMIPKSRILKEDLRVVSNSISNKNTGKKILIVDDELVNQQVLENQLNLHNFKVSIASSGQEAIDLVDCDCPDLILLDIMMPKMSGYDVCKYIRKKYESSKLPIIMITAKDQTADKVMGFKMGANDYITKPTEKDELISRINTHLHLSQINRATSRFFPEEYLQFLSKTSIIDVNLGDNINKNMAVMFSDIRSFTSLSESMTPQESFDFINSYLGKMTPEIKKQNGVIIKYVGDAIMAIFPNSANDSIQSAIQQLQKLYDYNAYRESKGRKPLTIGIGIHFGFLMFGLVGNDERIQGDVFSDNVNLASRLEGLTKFYKCPLIISENLYKNIPNPEIYTIRYLDKVRVKGRSKPINIFEVINAEKTSLRDMKKSYLSDYEKGIVHYLSGDFKNAKEVFESLYQKNPDDEVLNIYYHRINNILQCGDEKDWDGIYTFNEK